MEYSPVSLVNSLRIRPVATSRTVTFALATTEPDGSAIVPRMVPRTLCAEVKVLTPNSAASASNDCNFDDIAPSSELCTKTYKSGWTWLHKPYEGLIMKLRGFEKV